MWLLLVALCLLRQAQSSGSPSALTPLSLQSEKILFHGYPSEEYEVMTEDGYFLSLNRIPHGKEGTRTPVLIVHGFCLDGGDWVDNLPENSLAFILADAGYDVWIGNNRGSSWSRRHRSLSTASEEFWDFSFHEMAVYDLPAMVGFILMQTEQKQLFYVGHAQGSSLGFIAFSSLPHLAKKIKLFFALAPVYTFHHVRGPVLKLAFLSDLLLKVQEVFLGGYCQNPGISGNSCPLHYRCVIFLFGGFDRNNLNMVGTPGSPSMSQGWLGWGWGSTPHPPEPQVTGVLSPCQLRPPSYEIEAMRVPVAVWSGGHDWVTPHKETERLLSRLTHVVHHEHFPDWNHFDHHWGLNAPQRMYQRMVAMMEENP
uniref:Lipase n=1 Tax=Zonotrichia albicollis TaxID=44394 RepID=A0A8D2MAF7_ZONAL